MSMSAVCSKWMAGLLCYFYTLTPLSFRVVSSYQGENANKTLFIDFDMRGIIK